mmetsp:Transcript_45752/g.110899  ORF Transcript_45752/g.110899 Transcript_45752/m.110899 type:complete len:456 (-) Transcript_45752:29-1396(-)
MNVAPVIPLIAFSVFITAIHAFQPCYQNQQLSSWGLRPKPPRMQLSMNMVISLDRNAQRQIDQFQGWAADCGVQADNGFCLVGDMVDGNEDYRAVTSTGTSEGSRVLTVPSEMILSASLIAQEYRGSVESALQRLEEKGFLRLQPHFHLFLKILMEYEQGESSAYYPWLDSLPRRWNTAASFDYFCMSTLPPYIKKICQAKRDELSAFQESLKAFDYILPETKADDELVKFAYNVVMTRVLPSQEDYKIVPAADYFNHGNEANVAICYNEQTADCEVYASRDIAAGEALTLTYDMPTNPSHLLATYGFLNEAPATYCKLLFTNPSEKLKQIGYDPSQLLFSTQDGSISSPVWDVILYSKLERTPGMAEAKNAFYEAHMNGDEETKFAIHSQFQEATCSVLLEHVETILKEVSQLTSMMEKFRNEDRHPRLPLLMKHHAMVTLTFSKVRDNLLSMY